MRFLIDTDIASFFLKRRFAVLDRRMRAAIRAREVAISAITRAELRYDQALMPAEACKRHELIDAFLETIPVLDRDQEAADRYCPIAAALRKRGRPIGCMDTMIAAHALAEGMILVTNNTDDFQYVEGLVLENWTLE